MVVQNGVATMCSVLSMSASHMGFVQQPILQTQTTQSAMIKHRHALDLAMLKSTLTLKDPVQILYVKPDSTGRDTRPYCQPAQATFHANFNNPPLAVSEAVVRGRLGPCPLLRISDLQGYDEDSKPGASARAEQMLAVH